MARGAPRNATMVLFLLLFHACTALAAVFTPVSVPSLKFSDFGDRVGIFGSFAALSFYSYNNASSFLEASSDSNLYIRDVTTNNNRPLAGVSGTVSQMLALSSDTFLIAGSFTAIHNQTVQPPVIYNVTSGSISSLFPQLLGKRDDAPTIQGGSVKTTFVDSDLIYLGGDFEYNGTFGAAVYNQTSKSLSNVPFQGFGENGSVNTITKFGPSNSSTDGSIVFGGSFDTLGLSGLLVHNVSSNSTNKTSSLIEAEQMISLKHGTFTNVNGVGSEASIICPGSGSDWSVTPGQGGQWAVELPSEMKGVVPTKARLYVPDGDDSVKLFRIYSYPNNGIMNLSYIDPSSNERVYCDAWCPLLQAFNLQNATEANAKVAKKLTSSDVFVDPKTGSYATYPIPDTKTRTLGYGADYQEFLFENSVGLDRVGITVVDWYGSKGVLAGFEMYLDSIVVYGNNTLNEPNCGDDSESNDSRINDGDWVSATSLSSAVVDTNYLVSVVKDSKASITLFPNISYSGNYSLLLNTPGCLLDNSCSQRAIVNATVFDNAGNVLSSLLIYQNNEGEKFDYLYYGHFDGSSSSKGYNKVTISFHSAVDPSVSDPWMVVDKITTNIVSLDKYHNNKNSTEDDDDLEYINLNGLFEYSLANFTDFDESIVSNTSDDSVSKQNTYVGNSSINALSGKLNKGSIVNQFTTELDDLLMLGEFDSKNLSISNSAVIRLAIGDYNTTLNESDSSISRRDLGLTKRADSGSTEIFGAAFNDTVSSISSYNDDLVLVGKFSISGNNESVQLIDLSNSNKSTESINNFALYSESKWYGFGNSYIDSEFNQFSNISINNATYFIFSTSDGLAFQTWDNTHQKWASNNTYTLNISSAVNLNSKQQVLSGSSFNVMDLYNTDQAFIQKDNKFGKYGFSVQGQNNEFTESFFVNLSLSVIGGKFKVGSVTNVGLINNSNVNASMKSLLGDATWDDDAVVDALYVDSKAHYLFIGTNGSVTINDNQNLTGILIYDLKNNTFTSFQPAQLSNDGDPIQVNSIALHDQGSKLVVGGNFTLAGSLDCPALCVYDLVNTRWISPSPNSDSGTIDGLVTDIKFVQSNEILVSGNMSINNKNANMATYNFANSKFGTTKDSLNAFGTSSFVQKFILNDASNSNLNGRISAYGRGFVAGYDGSKWTRIDGDIVYNTATKFTDIKLLSLTSKNLNNNETYFDNDKILMVSGVFELSQYGLVNAALFNGSNWIPYIFSSTADNKIGTINTILINDSFRFQSSEDIMNKSNKLSKGKVVGISLACALGSTTLLGLLYIIPFFLLFRKGNGHDVNQRIQEKEMMNAVNPEDLFHEIDLQRNT